MKLDLFGILVALVLGNFVYQWLTKHQWSVAWDRSFFQAVALIAVLIFVRGN